MKERNKKVYSSWYRAFGWLARKNLLSWMPDELYLKIAYWGRMEKKLDLEHPQSFNEKLQWLKINNRKEEYSIMVDKYMVKEYVGHLIGYDYIIPNLGVWDKFEDIDFDSLPNQFVLKCTHDSGGLVICKDKSLFDIKMAREKISFCLKQNYYCLNREWPYKNVTPRIIAESYLNNEGLEDIPDYKIHCFNGIPRIILVCKNRFSTNGLTEDFYSTDWTHLDIKRVAHPNAKETISKPEKLEEMIELAKVLSKGIPFVRIDFYEVSGRVYFGEITFFPASGMEKFIPEEIDKKLGDLIELPKL